MAEEMIDAISGKEHIFSSSIFVPFKPSGKWMMPICPEESSLYSASLQNQMLISSGNILTYTLRNNALLAIWASLIPVILTYKINHHRYYISLKPRLS